MTDGTREVFRTGLVGAFCMVLGLCVLVGVSESESGQGEGA